MLYKVAYEEGQRALDDQVDEFNGVRTRAVQYLAFVGTATAFLVGTSLKAAQRDLAYYLMAGSATLLLLATLACVLRALVPHDEWNYRFSGKKLIDGWIEPDLPVPNEAQLYRQLTLSYDDMRRDNDTVLKKIRHFYFAEILLGTSQLILWILLTWIVS